MADTAPNKVFIICGNYGSGKTEFCLNFALKLRKESGEKVSIVDLDVLNPYFRSREKADFLAERGIDILGNLTHNMPGTDLPAVSADIFPALLRDEYIIIDLAGSPSGQKPLALFLNRLERYETLCVLNALRPGSQTAAEMVKLVRSMENFGGIKVTGLIHNTHLVHETTPDIYLAGQQTARQAAAELALPIKYSLIQENIYSQIKDQIDGEPILFGKLVMRQEWL